MPTESYYNPNTKRVESRQTTSKGQTEDAKAKERLTTVAGTGLGKKGRAGTTPAPKQEQGESVAAFAARYRAWRETDADAQARAKALR